MEIQVPGEIKYAAPAGIRPEHVMLDSRYDSRRDMRLYSIVAHGDDGYRYGWDPVKRGAWRRGVTFEVEFDGVQGALDKLSVAILPPRRGLLPRFRWLWRVGWRRQLRHGRVALGSHEEVWLRADFWHSQRDGGRVQFIVKRLEDYDG